MKKFILVVSLIVLISLGYLYIFLNNVKKKVFIVPSQKLVEEKTVQSYLKNGKAFNILLLGYSGGKHDGAYLTDSIIVVHLDPKNKKAFLISIPRDLWVEIQNEDSSKIDSKINVIYSIGLTENKDEVKGGNLAKSTVSQVAGFPIEYFVSLDFNGFKQTIDTLGGVDVNVEKTFDDYAYPLEGHNDDPCGHSPEDITAFTATISAEMKTWDYFSCRYEHLHFDQGLNYMNGEEALKYVRSRHSAQDGNDFGRSQRQRNLLVAVKEKVLSIGFIPKIIPFASSLGDSLRTDLTLADINAFIKNTNNLKDYQIINLALTDQNYLKLSSSVDGQSILIPKSGVDDWTEIYKWLEDEFADRTEIKESTGEAKIKK